RLWEDLVSVLRARRPSTVAEDELLRAFAGHGSDWLATRRGTQEVWSYADTAEFRDRLRPVVLDKVDSRANASTQLLSVLQQTAFRLHARQFEPYPACHQVCSQDPPLCLYRSAVADVVMGGRYQAAWRDADDLDAKSEDNRRQKTWQVCQDAAYELVEFPDEDEPPDVKDTVDIAARRVCLCFEQQMLANDSRKVPRTSRRILARVLAEGGL
ncbi:MAG TPA: ATP-binding protein, partial [Blastocatellia bacterium]|nr:ATP-binding protein [Blastocatellia bacterium]